MIISVLIYGAPIWYDALATYSNGRRLFLRVQRMMAIRICSAYLTVSLDASTLLARLPPLDLMARERKNVYYRLRDSKKLGLVPREDILELRSEERTLLANAWKERLHRRDVAGIDGILPNFDEWM